MQKKMRPRSNGNRFSFLVLECMKRGVEVRGPDGKYKRADVLEKELRKALERERVLLERMKRFAERNEKK